MNRTPFKRTMKNIKNFHGRHPGAGRFLCCRDNMLCFFRRREKTGTALQPVGIAEGDFSSIISARLSRPANRLPQHRFCLRIPQKPSRNFWQCSAPFRVCFESFRLFPNPSAALIRAFDTDFPGTPLCSFSCCLRDFSLDIDMLYSRYGSATTIRAR